jgi:hypothetical protein
VFEKKLLSFIKKLTARAVNKKTVETGMVFRRSGVMDDENKKSGSSCFLSRVITSCAWSPSSGD